MREKTTPDVRPKRKERKEPRASIFWRCTIANTLIYSLTVLLAVSLFILMLGVGNWKKCEKTVFVIRENIIEALTHARQYDTLWITLSYLDMPPGVAYRVIDQEGLTLAETTPTLPFPKEGTEGELYVNQSWEEETYRYTTLESTVWTNTADGKVLLQVSYNVTWFMEILESVFLWLLMLFPIILLISLLVSYITTRISFAPVRELSQKIQDITPASLGESVQLNVNNRELEELLDNYNAMSQRLRASFEDQRLFVSNASHELRSPVATIKGYSSMLLRWGKEDKELLEESLHVIDTEAQRMADIIQTLLMLTRYESERGQANLSFSWVNLRQLIQKVTEDFERNGCERGARIKIENDLQTDLLWGDAKCIVQALRILLENALQYGRESPVVIHVYSRKEMVVIEVRDQGIGISDDEKEKIKQRFYRSKAAREAYSEGFGLGLPMLVKILQAHQGDLEIESQLDVGTTMRTIWPRKINDGM